MTGPNNDALLKQVAPLLEAILTRGTAISTRFYSSDIKQQTVTVKMRDGISLASDIYLPSQVPAPVLVTRTPYGRSRRATMCLTLAQCGYAVVSQDCRGTGGSEPDTWQYYLFEPEDSVDFVEWVTRQDWCDGFVGSFGGSYAASTQWCMAAHPRMSAIIPEVGGLGVTFETGRLYMYLNAYVRSIGKTSDHVPTALPDLEREMLPETLAGGYFNEPLETGCSQERRRRAWRHFCRAEGHRRVKLLQRLFNARRFTYVEMERLCTGPGRGVAYGAHSIPSTHPASLSQKLHCPALLITGWYDWNVRDVLASWTVLMASPHENVRRLSRLLITPGAHNEVGYREGRETHPELERVFRTSDIKDLLLGWYSIVRGDADEEWPTVIYYLLGANQWHVAPNWPPPTSRPASLYLDRQNRLETQPPASDSPPDRYVYDPNNPTPTVGGSIVSHVYAPGSADVSSVQRRSDVLVYTTPALAHDLDVVGPLRLSLYVSSSAVETDFSARLSDVFPDGRAIQIQSGLLRTRYRHIEHEPTVLAPGQIYCLEIDMWATANRFQVGHRLRLDISSADFPRYDRNSNAGGADGPPRPATQTVYHQRDYPSELHLSVLGAHPWFPKLGDESLV